MVGAGADQVTVQGVELGRGDAVSASVPMLTEPATRSDRESPIGPAVTSA